jgi:hypothetical protein
MAMGVRRLLASALAGVAAMAVMSPPSVARPIERGHFSESITEFVDCDGLPVRVNIDVDWAFLLNSRGRDRLPYGMETSHGEQVWTNLTTGKRITVVTNFVVKDQRITDNGDGTFTILVKSSGGVRVYGPDGKPLLNDPGQSRSVLLIDNGGTLTDPFDDVFLEDLGRVKSTGRNDLDGRSFCDLMRDYTI